MVKKIGRPSSSSGYAPVSARVAPVMKYTEACHLADKTSRTIVKISQLQEVTLKPGYSTGDPNQVVEKYIDKLKKRVNRRLQKLAKWSDSSNDDRHAEFRNVPRGVPINSKLYAFSKPASLFFPQPMASGQMQSLRRVESNPAVTTVPQNTTVVAEITPSVAESTTETKTDGTVAVESAVDNKESAPQEVKDTKEVEEEEHREEDVKEEVAVDDVKMEIVNPEEEIVSPGLEAHTTIATDTTPVNDNVESSPMDCEEQV